MCSSAIALPHLVIEKKLTCHRTKFFRRASRIRNHSVCSWVDVVG